MRATRSVRFTVQQGSCDAPTNLAFHVRLGGKQNTQVHRAILQATELAVVRSEGARRLVFPVSAHGLRHSGTDGVDVRVSVHAECGLVREGLSHLQSLGLHARE
jgi:hypothetical protein